MSLHLRLLGAPSITVDGAPLRVDTRKATALLALLALREDRVSRAVAADMFWPDAPSERARASLRRTLSALTTGLGHRFVHSDRDALWLGTDDVDCDVRTLREASRELRSHATQHPGPADDCTECAATESAADLAASGTLLEGFTLRDAPAFDDWVQVEAEAVRRDTALLLERRSRRQLRAGEAEASLETARGWLALDPLQEPAHRAVMRAAAAAGRRDEAVAQYRTCVATLDRELHVAPLTETTALYEAILADAPPPPPPSRITPRPPTDLERRDHPTPLVARDEELATLLEVHGGLGAGVACVAIEGEAGIGKTRITQEFAEYLDGRGARTATVACREDEGDLTCGPLVDLLRDAHERDPAWSASLGPGVLTEVGRVVPEATPDATTPPPLDSPGAQIRFLDGLFAAVAAVVRGAEPGVVVVDDLHWADPTTIDVLARGLRRQGTDPLLLVVTWRTELVGHDHPLRRLLRTGASTTTLQPPRLDRDEVEELVRDTAPGALDLTDRLFEESEGIPFFLVQYLAAMGDGRWELPGPVRDLVAARLEPLSDLARQCLTAASVLGRSFELEVMIRTSGRSEDEVVAAVDELLERRLLAERPTADGRDARYDFTHTKIREVVEATTSLARRRLLHRRAAEALLATDRDGSAVAARVAHHLAAAGDERRAAVHHAIAADRARSLFANVEALEHLEAALALGHDDVLGLQRAVGDLQLLAGRYTDARASYAAASARTTDRLELADLEHRLGVLHLRWGAWVLAASHLDQALERLADAEPSCLRARVRADRAAAALRCGDQALATATVAAAVEEATACGDDRAIAEARNTAALVERRAGATTSARTHLEVALDHAGRLHDPGARVAALNNLALVLAAEGRGEDALAAAKEALERCSALGDRHHEAALHSNLADLLHAAGRTDEALPHLTTSARLLSEIGEDPRSEPEVWKLTDW